MVFVNKDTGKRLSNELLIVNNLFHDLQFKLNLNFKTRKLEPFYLYNNLQYKIGWTQEELMNEIKDK